MKKAVNKNFILCMLVVTALVLLCVLFGVATTDIGGEMESVKSDISGILEGEEVNDVEGYGVIAESIGLGFGVFASAILFAMIFLVGAYAFVLFIVALIARLVFKSQGKRLVIYRVLMGIEYVLQAGLILLLGDMLVNSGSGIVLVIIVPLLAEIVYGVRNTYTDRICE